MNMSNEFTSSEELVAPAQTFIYTLYFHQTTKRFLITSAERPPYDFIEEPVSYGMFGGRRDQSREVHLIGQAAGTAELEAFVMTINTVMRYSTESDQNVRHYMGLQAAFEDRYKNLVIQD